MILASTVLGKLAGTDGVMLGVIGFAWFISTFPDDAWQKRWRPYQKRMGYTFAAGIIFIVLIAVLNIWGVK